MKTFTAAQAKLRFGEFLDSAQREPVIVTKNNRPVGVMISMQDLEDTIWAEKARAAIAEGFLNAEESAALVDKLRHADD